MRGGVNLRLYAPEDAGTLAALYRRSVLQIGSQAYDAAQVAAWASFADDREAFHARLSRGLTVVAELEGRVAAFGQLEPYDHVDFLYCDPAFSRRGCAAAIYAWLEMFAMQHGEDALHTEASHVSRPFFEKMGFELVEPESVERSGVVLERFRLRKALL